MYRIKYLFGILSAVAAMLYLAFGILSLHAVTLTAFDRAMPFYLCSLHLIAALTLLGSSYREHKRKQHRLESALNELLRMQSSVSPEDIARAASIPLAEAHEYLQKKSEQRALKIVTKSEHLIVRAFPPHSLN